MEIKKTTIGLPQTIYHFPEGKIEITVTVSDSGIIADATGRKIVKQGMPVGGGRFDDINAQVSPENGVGSAAEGVLVSDVDVTAGPATGSMCIAGYPDKAKCEKYIGASLHADAIAALKPRIMFMPS